MHFLCDFTQKAVVAVYQSLFNLKVAPMSHSEGAAVPPGALSGMVGSISFAGKITGGLYMIYTETLACKLAQLLIGVKPSHASQPEVGDVIGEIAQLVGGEIKRRAAVLGYSGLAAPP